MIKRALRKFTRDDRGTAAVEFAIISTAFISLLMGVIYLAIILFTNVSLHYAVERGIRLAMINPAVSQSDITTEVNGYLTSTGLPSATVSYSVSGTPATAHISATLARTYTVPLISTFNITYAADAYAAQGT
jgi:Flp pilus assembly protein TadG